MKPNRVLCCFSALRMLLISVSLAGGLMTPAISEASQIRRTFKSDGCTLFPDGTRRNHKQWTHCCYQHDLRLWAGGSRILRDQADLDLRACVAETGARRTAKIMYWGIRLGAHSPIRISSGAWGNAWKTRPGYRALTSTEIDQLELALLYSNVSALDRQTLIENLSSDAKAHRLNLIPTESGLR